MDEEGDLPAVMLLMIYLSLGVSALRFCTLAYEFWKFCYRRRQEQEEEVEEEHQEFKLAEEDAEDITVSSLAAAGVLGSSSSCAVCLEEFREGDLCRRLRCLHVFHPCCIQAWLNKGRSKTCPLCRMKFLPQEEEEEEPHAFSHV